MHSILAPSSAHMWMNCPGSLYLQEGRKAGIAAQEGRQAHDLAYKMLVNTYYDVLEYPQEMLDYIRDYVAYINEVKADTKYYESKVNIFDKCFGTADVIACSWNKLHVIDLKYGENIPVDIHNNEQLLLYAWGAYRTLWDGDTDPHLIRITIYQPRTDDELIKSQQILFSQLVQFIKVAKVKAREAFSGSKRKRAGDWCMFCQQKYVCRERVKCAWDK